MTNSITAKPPLLDIDAIAQASQTISSTLELKPLKAVIVRIMAENSHARRGIFLSGSDKKIVVEAEYIEGKTIQHNNRDLEDFDTFPHTIIHRAFQSKEVTTVEDIHGIAPFMGKKEIKSMICIPIIKQNKLLGVCYFEQVPTHHFSVAPLLKILASQAAISLENVMLRTEQEQIQLKTQQHQLELAHLTRLTTMGEMTTGIATQTQSPLTQIIENIHSCLSYLKETTVDKKIIRAMELAETQTQRVQEMVCRLKDFVRHKTLKKQTIDLNQLLYGIVNLIKDTLDEHGIQLDLILPKENISLLLDKLHIEQALLNITTNAIEAMLATPCEQHQLSIHSQSKEGAAHIHIVDTGPGITPAVAKHLFNPFVTTKTEGMGLGLSIAHSLITAHGGTISARPSLPQGTVFHVVLNG